MIGSEKEANRWAVRLLLAVTCACGFASLSRADFSSKVTINCSPVFLGGDISEGVRVELENNGPPARGVLTLKTKSGSAQYPLELPSGVKKAFDAYPSIGNPYDDVDCELATDQGSVSFHVPTGNFGAPLKILEITDSFGGLQFLKLSSGQKLDYEFQATPLYVKPETAPSRLASYRSLTAVVLGPGAERLSDEAIRAISLYVESGGRLFFVGGSGIPAAMDSRWEKLMPVQHVRAGAGRFEVPVTVPPHVNLKFPIKPFQDTGSLAMGSLGFGTTLRVGLTAVRPYGLGLVALAPFDIFEGPIRNWNGLPYLITTMANWPTGQPLVAQNEQDAAPGNYTSYAGGTPTPLGYGPNHVLPGSFAPTNGEHDPFGFQPPHPESMALIIGVYLILVAPVNFFILRRLRKAEWAWFTTPLISVIFSVVLLQASSQLYGGSLSSTATGTLLVAESTPQAIFRGTSDMFFPKGGSYDLKLNDVDWVIPAAEHYYSSGMLSDQDVVDTVDGGDLQVPDYRVRNLQFKSIEYEQVLDAAGWFTLEVRKGTSANHITLTNHSPYNLVGGTLLAEGGSAPVIQLAGGQSVEVDVPVVRGGSTTPEEMVGYGFFKVWHRPLLSGTLQGFRPGPQLGTQIGQRSNVQVLVVGNQSTGEGHN